MTALEDLFLDSPADMDCAGTHLAQAHGNESAAAEAMETAA